MALYRVRATRTDEVVILVDADSEDGAVAAVQADPHFSFYDEEIANPSDPSTYKVWQVDAMGEDD